MNRFVKYIVVFCCLLIAQVPVVVAGNESTAAYALSINDLPAPLPQGWDNRVVGAFLPSALRANGLPPAQKIKSSKKILTLNDSILIMLRDNPDIISANLQRINDKYSYAEKMQRYGWALDDLKLSVGKNSGENRTIGLTPSVSWRNQLGTAVTFNYSPRLVGGNNSSGSIELKQPLMRGLNMPHLDYLDAKDSLITNRITYRSNIEQVVNQVILAYVQQVQRKKDYANQLLNLQQQKQQLDQAKKKIKDHKLAPADIQQQQSSYLSSQVNVAKQKINLDNGKQDFFQLLGLSPIETANIDPKITTTAFTSEIPTEQAAIAYALKNSNSYKTALLLLRSKQRDILRDRDKLRWGLDLDLIHSFGNAGGNGSAGGSGSGSPDNIASLNLTIPMNTLTQRGDLISSRISYELEKLKLRGAKQGLVRAIHQDFQTLKNDKNQLVLDKKNADLKASILKNMQLKLHYGLTTSFEVVSLRQQLVLQQQAYVATQMQYFLDINKLHYDMGDELSLWNIKLR